MPDTLTSQLSRLLCRFHTRGGCLQNKCKFGHDSSACIKVDRRICWYNLTSSCKNPECRYLHVTPQQVLEDSLNPGQSELARRLSSCRSNGMRRCCNEDSHEPDLYGSDGERLVCGICMDSIHEKLKPQHRKFGLLECCKHVFCIDCLRKWRQNRTYKSEVSRSCPECRQVSHLVLASHRWVENLDHKRRLFQGYRDRLRYIRCRFDSKSRVCPFGSACMYKHERLRPGSSAQASSSSQPRHSQYNSPSSPPSVSAQISSGGNSISYVMEFHFDSSFVTRLQFY